MTQAGCQKLLFLKIDGLLPVYFLKALLNICKSEKPQHSATSLIGKLLFFSNFWA